MKNIAIVGAGLVGTVLAVYLAKRGYKVDVYERRADMRRQKISVGRSINLAISRRGIYALQEIGVAEAVLQQAIPMYGRMLHPLDAAAEAQFYSTRPDECIYSISRETLNILLMNYAEFFSDLTFHFDSEVTDYHPETEELRVAGQTLRADRVIAADGAASHLRRLMQQRKYVQFHETWFPHAYKELRIPRQYAEKLEKNYLHIWPRRAFMLIALPNNDGSFVCTLFLPLQGEASFANLRSETAVRRFFEKFFPDAITLMPELEKEFFIHPTGRLKTLRGEPWDVQGKLLFIGDAAHAIAPFFGQGMNCGFEDCTVLNALLDELDDDWQAVMPRFFTLRKNNTDAIAQMSFENYLEMRDRVADREFHLQKRIEKRLVEKFPDIYVPKYNLVSFSREPYAYAYQCGEIQQAWLRDLSQQIKSLDEVTEAQWLNFIQAYQAAIKSL